METENIFCQTNDTVHYNQFFLMYSVRIQITTYFSAEISARLHIQDQELAFPTMFLFPRPLPFANIYPLMSGNTPQRDVHYI